MAADNPSKSEVYGDFRTLSARLDALDLAVRAGGGVGALGLSPGDTYDLTVIGDTSQPRAAVYIVPIAKPQTGSDTVEITLPDPATTVAPFVVLVTSTDGSPLATVATPVWVCPEATFIAEPYVMSSANAFFSLWFPVGNGADGYGWVSTNLTHLSADRVGTIDSGNWSGPAQNAFSVDEALNALDGTLAVPGGDGAYTLTASKVDGVVTYAWTL